eukprot:scaffold12850_cov109-Isochrysis_galbana.AAC.7
MGVFGGKKAPKPEELYTAVKTSNIASLKELLGKGCDPTGHKDAMVCCLLPLSGLCPHVCAPLSSERESLTVLPAFADWRHGLASCNQQGQG